jgi:hypothetical protein
VLEIKIGENDKLKAEFKWYQPPEFSAIELHHENCEGPAEKSISANIMLHIG